MKIIITVNSYYPLTDGVQTVTKYHAEGLVKKGHKVTVVTRTIKDLSNKDMHNGVEILRINVYTKHTINRGNKQAYQRLILELTNEADLLINVCAQTATTDWVFPILNKIECKKVLYMHGMASFKWHKYNFKSMFSVASKIWNDLRWKIYYKNSIKFFEKYDGIIHLHQFDKAYEYFNRKGLNKGVVIENAADDEFFDKTRFLLEGTNDNYIICVANYIELKNQELCLKAFYKSKESNYALIFIGSEETPYYYKLIEKNKEFSKRFGERDVRFLKHLSRIEVIKYIKNAKMYVLGSTTEKYPVSIIEAMASGIPYISTNVGCVRFLPGGVVINNYDEMAYWITRFCEDLKLANIVGTAGKYYANSNLMTETQINKLEEYLRLL